MDQKTWLWKKKSSEKTLVANGKADLPLKGNVEEVQLPNEKEVALEKSTKILNERITSLLNECNAKEEELKKHAKTVQEANAGQEKAEAEVLHLKKDLDDALQEKYAANERTSSLNAALKDCMQQLSSIREEQEQRVHTAIMRTSKEFEEANNRLSETGEKLANLTIENSHLSKVLVVKEGLIEKLTNRTSQVEAEFDALKSRLDSVEKENAFLRYELRMLEKDLDIRNEEIEISRRSTETSEKRQLESVKKIKRLEAECQRLRILVRKRVTSFTPSANIKSEVETQGRYNTETSRRKSNPRGGEDDDISSKRINFLVERLQNVEQENKILRDALADKEKESSYSSTQCTPMISKLSNVGTETDSSCSRSWASALISELENFKDRNFKSTPEHQKLRTSQISLMDDFVEMEKLAIVAVDVPNTSSPSAPVLHPDKCLNNMDSTGKELVPVGEDVHNNMNLELQANGLSSSKNFDWLQTVLKMIIEQVHDSKRSIDELLEDIKIAFESEAQRVRNSPQSREHELLPISGYITWNSPATSPRLNSSEGVSNMVSLAEEKNCESMSSSSIAKVVELLGRFTCTTESPVLPNQLTADSDYEIHAFGWKNSELSNVVQKFMHTCDLLLSGTIDFENFAAELSSTLEWILVKSIKNKDSYALASELQQSREIIRALQIEIEDLIESKRMIEDQFENQKSINEDLDTQLTLATVRLNEVSQKLSSLEVELEDRNHCCEELEGTRLELQLQLESISSEEIPKDNANQNEKLLQTGWEIKAASAKLAECEATMLNLGNQLKALAKPNKASNTNKILCNYRNSMKLNKRFSLLDRMLPEADTGKELVIRETNDQSAVHDSNAEMENSGALICCPKDEEAKTALSGALIVVPSKKRTGGFGFLRKLLLRRKIRSSHKSFLPFSL